MTLYSSCGKYGLKSGLALGLRVHHMLCMASSVAEKSCLLVPVVKDAFFPAAFLLERKSRFDFFLLEKEGQPLWSHFFWHSRRATWAWHSAGSGDEKSLVWCERLIIMQLSFFFVGNIRQNSYHSCRILYLHLGNKVMTLMHVGNKQNIDHVPHCQVDKARYSLVVSNLVAH